MDRLRAGKIGRIQITDNIDIPSTSVKGSQKLPEETQTTKESSKTHIAEQMQQQTQANENDKTTGMITIQQTDSVSYVAVIVSVITLVLVGLMFRNSRKRTPWGN